MANESSTPKAAEAETPVLPPSLVGVKRAPWCVFVPAPLPHCTVSFGFHHSCGLLLFSLCLSPLPLSLSLSVFFPPDA